MKNPVSDSSKLSREWRRKLGDLGFDQVITMIENNEPIPWRIPPSTRLTESSDRQELYSILTSKGMEHRTKIGGDLANDEEDMELQPFIMCASGVNWLPYHYPHQTHLVRYWDGPVTGFRIARNR